MTLLIPFNLRDQIGYCLYKSADLTAWKIWEDFGALPGNHAVTVPLNSGLGNEFYKLQIYQP